MIKNISAITASSFLSMLFLGVAATLIGAAARNIGLTPNEIGLMITFQILGFMISVVISGALADSHEKPRILLIGSFILSAAFLSFYLTQIFNVHLFIMFMIGAGIGTYEGVTDTMLIDYPSSKREPAYQYQSLFRDLWINFDHRLLDFPANGLAKRSDPIWDFGSIPGFDIRADKISIKESTNGTLFGTNVHFHP